MSEDTSDDFHRRSGDSVVGLLRDKIDGVEKQAHEIGKSLNQHVAECAVTNKRVLIGVAFLGAWVVAHSPETEKLAVAIFKAFMP